MTLHEAKDYQHLVGKLVGLDKDGHSMIMKDGQPIGPEELLQTAYNRLLGARGSVVNVNPLGSFLLLRLEDVPWSPYDGPNPAPTRLYGLHPEHGPFLRWLYIDEVLQEVTP